jgi:hypothetical protein
MTDRTVVYYADLTPAQRERTLDAYGDLLAAAQQARRDGWLPHEREPLLSEARRLGVFVWPALMDRITREAVQTTAAP